MQIINGYNITTTLRHSTLTKRLLMSALHVQFIEAKCHFTLNASNTMVTI